MEAPMALVKHHTPASDAQCPECGDWLKHWERAKGKAPYCARNDCFCAEHDQLVGARVVPANTSLARSYIVPLCKKCHGASKDGAFSVMLDLVRADLCEV